MLREDLGITELLFATEIIHKLKPALKEYVCSGIEIPQPNDRNVVFHMCSADDKRVVMISTDYFIKQ
jgi:hypothetical protein